MIFVADFWGEGHQEQLCKGFGKSYGILWIVVIFKSDIVYMSVNIFINQNSSSIDIGWWTSDRWKPQCPWNGGPKWGQVQHEQISTYPLQQQSGHVASFGLGGGETRLVVCKIAINPIGSMYGIFTYIWVIFGVNVGKYSIHGSYGNMY